VGHKKIAIFFDQCLLRQTKGVVDPVQPSEVVDNADGWSLLTALDLVTIAVVDDNFMDSLLTVTLN